MFGIWFSDMLLSKWRPKQTVISVENYIITDWNITLPKQENVTNSHWELLQLSDLLLKLKSLSFLDVHSQLLQVLRQKQVDSPDVKQVSVRRFATFDLFTRKRLLTQDSGDTADDQWVEYRSVCFPECSALLRYTRTCITITHNKTGQKISTCWFQPSVQDDILVHL